MASAGSYDPFAPGPFPVGERTIQATDQARGRVFPCDIWHPSEVEGLQLAARPLIVYSHSGGGNRRSGAFLATHLASHGYVVAALDHSELVAPELARREGEAEKDRAARIEAVIGSRVPDIRFLLDHLLGGFGPADIAFDGGRIGLVGHSFGGWTVLATAEVEPRVRAVVAMSPGGSAQPRPGILPLTLAFAWDRDIPTLYLDSACQRLRIVRPHAGIEATVHPASG